MRNKYSVKTSNSIKSITDTIIHYNPKDVINSAGFVCAPYGEGAVKLYDCIEHLKDIGNVICLALCIPNSILYFLRVA